MTQSVVTLALMFLFIASPDQTNPAMRDVSATTGAGGQPQTRQAVSTALINAVDAGRAKVGDAVRARLYSGLSVPGGPRVPPGSVITGHITDVSKLGKGSIESRLAVVFDYVQLADGRLVALHMGIAGLAAAPPIEELGTRPDMRADTGSSFPGARSTGVIVDPGGQHSTTTTTGGTGGTRVTRTLPGRTAEVPNSVGPTLPGDRVGGTATVGSTIPGISLRPSLDACSVLVSTSDNIALRSGTPLMLLTIDDR